MTLLETLRSRKGGLLRIKSKLYWYEASNLEKHPGRVCLLLDAIPSSNAHVDAAGLIALGVVDTTPVNSAVAHLLIDGSPRYVWVVEREVEVINEAG